LGGVNGLWSGWDAWRLVLDFSLEELSTCFVVGIDEQLLRAAFLRFYDWQAAVSGA
jgi:hypothetical protein